MHRLALPLTGTLLILASCAAAAERPGTAESTLDRGSYTGGSPEATSPTMVRLQPGDPAPAFSYLDADGGWHGFRQLFARGPILLVFGARDNNIKDLERVEPMLGDLGVEPVMVADMGNGSAGRYAQRMGWTSAVVGDPSRAIAELYGTLSPSTSRHAPSFFVIDTHQTIRLVHYGALPSARQMLAASARGLGRPLPQSALSANRRD